MNRVQKSNLPGDFECTMNFNESFEIALSYFTEQLSIDFAYLNLEIEEDKLCITKGTFDFDKIALQLQSYEDKVKQHQIEYKVVEQVTPSVSIVLGVPLIINSNKIVGTLCFLQNEGKELSEDEIKKIEFGLKQIQCLVAAWCSNLVLQKEISKHQEKFDLFTENSKEIFFELSHSGEILFISNSWTTETGYSVEEVIGKNTANYVHPDDVKKLGVYLSKLIPNEKSNNSIAYRIQHKNGNYVWHSSDVKLIEKEGEFFYIGNCRDVTAFIEAQQEVSNQKEFYGKILDRLPIDLGVWNENHRYLYLNQAAIKNDELRKFIIGKDDFDYAKHTGRDDSFAKSRREKFTKALTTKEIVEWEDTIDAHNGERFFHTRKFIPIYNDDGSFDMMTGYGIDITESKRINEEIIRSRQLITNVIQNTAVGIIVQGPQSEFLEYNKSACEMLGLTEDQMLGKTSFDPHWKVIHLDGTEFKPEEHPVPLAISRRYSCFW